MTFLRSNYFFDRTNKSLLKYLKWRWIYFIRLRYHLRNYNQSRTLIAPIRTSSFQRDNFELGLTEWVVLPIDRGCSESWRNLSLHPWCERLCFSFTLSNALTNHLLLLGSLRCISKQIYLLRMVSNWAILILMRVGKFTGSALINMFEAYVDKQLCKTSTLFWGLIQVEICVLQRSFFKDVVVDIKCGAFRCCIYTCVVIGFLVLLSRWASSECFY